MAGKPKLVKKMANNNHRKTRRQRNLEKLVNALRLGYKIPPALANEVSRFPKPN